MRYEKYMIPESIAENADDKTHQKIDTLNSSARQILKAATELFVEYGYNTVTTRDIAARANVNLGLIPYYFKTKENLAGVVTVYLNDKIYHELFHIGTPKLGAAEKIYIYTVLLQTRFMERYKKFMLEYTATSTGNSQISNVFREMSQDLIQEYHLDITPAQNEIYMAALKGAERLLLLRSENKELDITFQEIVNIIISDYFFNLGLPDETIAAIITRSKNFIRDYYQK